MSESVSVLVVDDEVDVRETLCSFLELFPEIDHIIEASDGTDALRKISNQSFKAIITDLMMPKMGGIELIKNIRQNEKMKKPEKPVPIVILSANVTGDEVKKALGLGIKYVMTKPCSAEQFVEKVQEVFKKEYAIDMDVDL
jgi:CheY-like chemotaxis protein